MSRDNAKNIIAETSVLCLECRTSHPAALEKHGKKVMGRVQCPTGERLVKISSNAEMFQAIRSKSQNKNNRQIPLLQPSLINLISITSQCNFCCPICYAAAGPSDSPSFLSMNEIKKRLVIAKKNGIRLVSFAGGEPTLHPHLADMISLARNMGLRSTLATNGLRFWDEPGFASSLKKAGLSKVSLQFDTFDSRVHLLMRGNSFIEEKICAAQNITGAGLQLGTITTVTSLNLAETPRILEFGLSMAPSLNTIVFQAAAPVGRYELGMDTIVDREQIIQTILSSGVIPDTSFNHVRPLPRYEPWNLRLHPDCAVNILLSFAKGEVEPLDNLLEIEKLYTKLNKKEIGRSWIERNLVPLIHILKYTKPRRHASMLRTLAGFMFKNRRHGMLIIGIGAYCSTDFIDVQRISRCASAELTCEGPVSPCLLYSGISPTEINDRECLLVNY